MRRFQSLKTYFNNICHIWTGFQPEHGKKDCFQVPSKENYRSQLYNICNIIIISVKTLIIVYKIFGVIFNNDFLHLFLSTAKIFKWREKINIEPVIETSQDFVAIMLCLHKKYSIRWVDIQFYSYKLKIT